MNLKEQLISKLRSVDAKIDVVSVDSGIGNRYYDVEHKTYPAYTLEQWVQQCVEVIDESKPLYIWDVVSYTIDDHEEIVVYGSMTFK